MEKKEIFELISRFENSTLTKMEMRDDNFSLNLEREKAIAPTETNEGNKLVGSKKQKSSQEDKVVMKEESVTEFETVKAPLVGVFYESAAPSDPPYVEKGQKVKKGQTLCLVEAMKMMNELKSPIDGKVVNIYGINGELVEYGQILFEVEPC